MPTDHASPHNGSFAATNVVAIPSSAAAERPSDKVIAFVKRHPTLTIAGALAAGLAISAVVPRSRRVMGKALRAAEAAGSATAIFGREAGEKAHSEASYLGRGARKEASRLANRAEKAGDRTLVALEKYGLGALAAASALGRAAAERASTLGEAASDTAAKVGDAAAKQAHKAKVEATALADRAHHRAFFNSDSQ